MKKVLIFAPHPDDETLGCGGTILKHIKSKDEVYWCIATLGNKKMGHDSAHFKKRKKIIKDVSKKYGFKKTYSIGFPTGELDKVGYMKVIESFTKVIKKVNPDYVYDNYSHDVHTDHDVTFRGVISSTKNFNFPNIKKIFCYETVSETEFLYSNTPFNPNFFNDISEHIEEKIEIFSLYKTEVMKQNLPRSIANIKNIAKYRGSRIGKSYAEAFMLIFSNEL